MDEWISAAEAVALPGMGEARFRRLCREGRLSGSRTVPGCEGRQMFRRDFTELRVAEDIRASGGAPPVVRKAYGRPAPPPAGDFYGTVWTEEAARQVLGRDVFTKATRAWSLRPVAVRGGVQLFRRSDVQACLPRVLPPAVQREYNELRRLFRAAGLGG
jgi:hypothetical protein